MIYAVDFDGTLCENKWPNIGEPNTNLRKILIVLRAKGDKLILWTCREGEILEQAVEWCKSYGLEFDAVNDNLPDSVDHFGDNSRKVYANFYIDDKSDVPHGFVLDKWRRGFEKEVIEYQRENGFKWEANNENH